MSIILLDERIDWLYEEIYKDNTWQCRQSIVEELFSALDEIKQKEYGRSFSSKFKVDKFVDIYCFSCRETTVLYLPCYRALVKY